MSDIRSPLFAQYRSEDKVFLFRSKNGNVEMETYDRNHQQLKTQTLSQAAFQGISLPTQTMPHRDIVHLLLSIGHIPTTQPERVFVPPFHKSYPTFQTEATKTLQGHSNHVITLQVLPGGLLASGSWDNTIKIWDPKQAFKCIQTLQGHRNSVYTLQVLPGGLLASGSCDNTIKIWGASS